MFLSDICPRHPEPAWWGWGKENCSCVTRLEIIGKLVYAKRRMYESSDVNGEDTGCYILELFEGDDSGGSLATQRMVEETAG